MKYEELRPHIVPNVILNVKSIADPLTNENITSGVYFHRNAEVYIADIIDTKGFEWEPPDLCFIENENDLIKGVYIVEFYGKKGYLFHWFKGVLHRGLICLTCDEEAIKDAFEKYLNNSKNI